MRPALLFVVLLSSSEAFAESTHYEQIRVDGGITGAVSAITDRNSVGVVAEVKAMATDHIAVGGRVEIAVMFGGIVGSDELPLDIGVAGCGLLKGEYLFGTHAIRPFVGVGAGLFTIGSHSIEDGPNTRGIRTEIGNYFGIAPQAGIDLGRLRFGVTYNAIVGASLDVRDTINGVERTRTFSQNYLSLELSFRFGGGRKPAAPAPSSMYDSRSRMATR
ncbi:MAG: hypothetical protein ACKV2T_08000 [Kofleriaceae bacterium]